MSILTSSLNDLDRADRLEAEARRRDDEAERHTLEPVEKRLIKLLAAIPADEQARGLSIVQLQCQLKPRGRGHLCAHIGEIGAALRRLGFMRKRAWRPSEGFVSRWYPVGKAMQSQD
jgi:hypothetical protein